MADFIKLIEKQLNSLTDLLAEIPSAGKLSDEHLLMRGRKKQTAFYLCDSYGRIPKGSHRLSSELAYEIARNKYYGVLSTLLKNNIEVLKKTRRKYLRLDEENLMKELPLVYREALMCCGGEALGTQGKAASNEKAGARGRSRKGKALKDVLPIENAHIAIDGTPVRSLGEVIIYNALLRHNVDFEYEAELMLIGNEGEILTRYPDFTIRLRDRRIYWEHVGMYGDDEYRKAYEEKIKLYYENGIVQGLNLIVTFAQQGRFIDSHVIDAIARCVAEIDEIK